MPVQLDSSLASVQTLTSSCSTMWRADAVVLSAKRHSTARILAIALKGRAGLRPASRSARAHSMHCPGIGSSCSQIDRGRRMTVNAAFRSCAR